MKTIDDLVAELEKRVGDRNPPPLSEDERADIDLLLPGFTSRGGLGDVLDDFGDLTTSRSGLPNATAAPVATYSYKNAMKGLSAAAKALHALWIETNSSTYSRQMDVVLLEAAAITQANLAASAAAYTPLKQAFEQSEATLRASYNRAKATAANLNLAADVISSFGKLIAAV